MQGRRLPPFLTTKRIKMEQKKIKIATRGIAEEMRNMAVGEVVQFPLEKYNYNTVRATPSTSLVTDRVAGKRWKTRVNYDDKCTEVVRIA